MKVREFINLLGLKPKPRAYGHDIVAFDLPIDGRVEMALWRHPKAPRTGPSQAAVEQLRRFLRPGDVALDIGAYVGDTTLPMALAVGAGGAVLAFEPNPYVFPVLQATAARNRDRTSIVALPYAALRSDGEVEFQYGDAGFNNGGYHEGVSRWTHGSAFTVRVQGRDLAALLARDHAALLPRLRFIKVDAEGHDLAVLESLDTLIRERRPYLQAEVFTKSDGAERRRLYDFFASRGYTVHRMDPERDIFAERLGPDDLERRRTFDLLAAPGA